MSLAEGFPYTFEDWNFVGYSLAGITTSILCKNASLCFDVGQGLPFQVGARHIAITHAHMDHASGLPYLLSQKNMHGQKETNLFVPESFADPLAEIFRLWQGVDGHQYDYNLQKAIPGELYPIGKLYSLMPFATAHRVPSLGYLLYQKKRKLRAGIDPGDSAGIQQAKSEGLDPTEEILDPMVAFTGDTKIEFLESHPDVLRAKILFMEVTFWDEDKPVEHARHWGHLHLDELIANLSRLKNERIVLIHASVRYTTRYLQEILAQRLSEEDRKRVVIFPRPL